jgi:cytidylate kinase
MKKLFELINKNLESSKLFGFLRGKDNTQLPIITISREKGSGGRPIAFLVARQLGIPWRVFHKDIVDQIAKEANLEKELIEEVDEDNIPLISQIIDNMMGKQYMNLSAYYKHLVRILSTIGNRGNAIIIGRGANFLFPQALKVRVICEMDERIRKVMKYEKVSRREAVEMIETSDVKRTEFTKSLFQHDPRKAHHYDLIIRTGKNVSLDDAAGLIVEAARKRFGL